MGFFLAMAGSAGVTANEIFIRLIIIILTKDKETLKQDVSVLSLQILQII